MTCNNCHNARSPAERSDEAWSVIVRHMRTRAGLTKSETEAVIAFLQASNEQPRSEEAASGRDEAEPSAAVATDRSLRSGGRRVPASQLERLISWSGR